VAGEGPAEAIGTVAEIWRHPVKSMLGEPLEEVVLGEWGVPGDRRWAVVDEASGTAMSAKRYSKLLEARAATSDGTVVVTLPDGRCGSAGEPALDTALSEWLERAVHLEEAAEEGGRRYEANVDAEDDDSEVMALPSPPGTFLDLAAVHLLSDASMRAMGEIEPAGDWRVARFRPTIFMTAVGEGFVEEAWIGTLLAVGGAGIMPFMPTIRCAMPGRAQPGIPKAPEVLRAINRHHMGNLGIYAAVALQGRVAIGDRIVPAGG
jgi:uncharacterized protein YcbX